MTQRPIDYRHNPNNFKTTYNQSFTDVPTFYASPLYQELHQRRQREPEPFDETEAIIRRDAELRELERRKLAEFYRRQAELEEARRENERQRQESPNRNQQQRHESPNRNRPRDESPQRYSYNEPLSHRSRYEDGIASRNNFQQAPISYR